MSALIFTFFIPTLDYTNHDAAFSYQRRTSSDLCQRKEYIVKFQLGSRGGVLLTFKLNSNSKKEKKFCLGASGRSISRCYLRRVASLHLKSWLQTGAPSGKMPFLIAADTLWYTQNFSLLSTNVIRRKEAYFCKGGCRKTARFHFSNYESCRTISVSFPLELHRELPRNSCRSNVALIYWVWFKGPCC